MFQTRMSCLLAAVGILAGLTGTAYAAEVECGSVYCFSQEDFAPEGDLTGICITGVPEAGTVALGGRRVLPGDVLTADQAAQLTFAPDQTEADSSAQVSFLPVVDGQLAEESVMTIGIRGKANQPPVAEDDALETYKNLALTGKLKVTDPEGEALTVTLTRSPKRGSVELGEDGSFTYTPKKNKVGVDSFTYTAADPAGKVSREATVTITILKPTDAAQYTDTLGQDCRFAAEWMKNTGIFTGETVGETLCFAPQREVTRGEFVTMLVKTLDIPAEEQLTCTGYEDDVPAWLRPYLAAAVRSGLTADLPDRQSFGCDEIITGAEAAVMLQNALDLPYDAPAMAEEEPVPAWAQASLTALEAGGIALEADEPLTRGTAALALYQAARLR